MNANVRAIGIKQKSIALSALNTSLFINLSFYDTAVFR